MGFLKDVEERVNQLENDFKTNINPDLPIVMRFDGSSFSTFTKNLNEPFDQRLTDLMIECCKYMVEITNARCGFVGSDEITIVIWEENEKSKTIYNGRTAKLLSELPSKLSVRFNKLLPKYIPEKSHLEPHFDAKIWNATTQEEAAYCFWMREESIIKNAITMACIANKLYSSNKILSKNGMEKIQMLKDKGIDFEDYPVAFKRGVYIQRKKTFRKIKISELESLPLKHQARKNPNLKFERTVFKVLELPKFTKIQNKTEVIMFGKKPKLYDTMQL